nr:hypothetical protein [Candidatus Sigynarchaeota archaeon]
MLWDIIMTVVTGFAMSSLKPALHNFLGMNIGHKILFIIGLIFTELVIVTISVWCWVEVDPAWLMLYWVDPAIFGTSAHFIYLLFPFFYGIAYMTNAKLIDAKKGRYAYLVVALFWLGFTIAVFPDFVTLFKTNETLSTVLPRAIDYPPQFIWYLSSYPAGDALWFLPMDYRIFFITFFISVVFLLGLHVGLGIAFARTDFYKNAPRQPPSKLLVFLTGFMFDISNRLLIHTAKKDYRLRQFVKSFKATVQSSTKDGLIERFMIFDGKGGIIYGKGKAAIDEKDPTYGAVIYRSVRDLFVIIATWGDIVEGMAESRFELRGNLSVLFKFQGLSNYTNPTKVLVEGSRQPIIDEKKPDE